MPMNPRLLRPIASGVHPEAAAWRTAVVANGGSVSASTMKAVSTFCAAIDAAGIRDRFYRLNLFCGDSDASLNAVRTPLYRGPSLGGTQYGNATDANNNFVQGDYAETGASGGLRGNATTKHLDTGLTQQTVSSDGFGHLSVFARHATYTGSVTFRMIGLISTSPTNQFYFVDTRALAGPPVATSVIGVHGTGASLSAQTGLSGGQLMTVTRSSASNAQIYLNASEVASDTVARTISSINSNIFVFAENRVGTGALTYADMRLASYSIGSALTASQMTAYNAAISAFQTALNRNSGV